MPDKTKILLIDDEKLVREELGALLEEEGYAVIAGADGEEGLELFRREHPELVITDVRMPRRDGLSVAMIIRQENREVPITIITGHGTEAMAIAAMRAGATDFIKKPVRPDDLTAALQRMEAARRPLSTTFTELPKAVELAHREWTYRMQNDFAAIGPFIEVILKTSAMGLDRLEMQEFGLALRELLQNAIEHGNLGLTYEDKTRALDSGAFPKLLTQRLATAPYSERQTTIWVRRQHNNLTVRITDEGEGFDLNTVPDPQQPDTLLASHGRGLLIARMLVDDLSFNKSGNEVTVLKKIPVS